MGWPARGVDTQRPGAGPDAAQQGMHSRGDPCTLACTCCRRPDAGRLLGPSHGGGSTSTREGLSLCRLDPIGGRAAAAPGRPIQLHPRQLQLLPRHAARGQGGGGGRGGRAGRAGSSMWSWWLESLPRCATELGCCLVPCAHKNKQLFAAPSLPARPAARTLAHLSCAPAMSPPRSSSVASEALAVASAASHAPCRSSTSPRSRPLSDSRHTPWLQEGQGGRGRGRLGMHGPQAVAVAWGAARRRAGRAGGKLQPSGGCMQRELRGRSGCPA